MWHKFLSLPFSFGSNLKTLYGLVPSRFPKCFISTISCIFRRAQRNLVFQVDGSGWSPGRYFPVWLAHRLNNSAWVSSSNSGLSTRTQGTLKIPISLSIHSKPSISPLSICCSSQGVNRCRGCFATEALRTKDRSFSKDETCDLDSIFRINLAVSCDCRVISEIPLSSNFTLLIAFHFLAEKLSLRDEQTNIATFETQEPALSFWIWSNLFKRRRFFLLSWSFKVNAHVCHKHHYIKTLICDWSLQIEVSNS